MRLLRQNDTSKAIVFLMVDSTDHITGKTGLSPTVTISKNGGAFSSPSGTVSEIGNGWYKLIPASSDVDTLGALLIHATATGADPVDLEYQVVAFDPYAATNLGLSYLDAAISSRSSHSATDVWSVANRTLTAFAFNVNLNMDQALPANPTANSTGEALKFADTRLDTAVSSRADGSAYTPARAAKLDNLDVAVSSRSTLTDSQVWSYSSRTLTSSVDVNMSQGLPASPSPNTVGEALKFADTRLDATVSSRSSHAPADVWNYSTRTLTSSVTISMDQTLPATPSANTVGEALKFADTRLDTTVGSRLAASSYVAPDNAGIAAIKAQTDKLTFDSSNNVYAAATVDEQAIADAIVSAIGNEQLVQVIVTPIAANLIQQATHGGHIESWTHARITASWTISGNDLSGHDLRMIIYKPSDPTTRVAEFKSDTGLTVSYNSGTGQSTISLNADPISAGSYAWIIRDQTTDTVILKGTMVVYAAPDAS